MKRTVISRRWSKSSVADCVEGRHQRCNDGVFGFGRGGGAKEPAPIGAPKKKDLRRWRSVSSAAHAKSSSEREGPGTPRLITRTLSNVWVCLFSLPNRRKTSAPEQFGHLASK